MQRFAIALGQADQLQDDAFRQGVQAQRTTLQEMGCAWNMTVSRS